MLAFQESTKNPCFTELLQKGAIISQQLQWQNPPFTIRRNSHPHTLLCQEESSRNSNPSVWAITTYYFSNIRAQLIRSSKPQSVAQSTSSLQPVCSSIQDKASSLSCSSQLPELTEDTAPALHRSGWMPQQEPELHSALQIWAPAALKAASQCQPSTSPHAGSPPHSPFGSTHVHGLVSCLNLHFDGCFHLSAF